MLPHNCYWKKKVLFHLNKDKFHPWNFLILVSYNQVFVYYKMLLLTKMLRAWWQMCTDLYIMVFGVWVFFFFFFFFFFWAAICHMALQGQGSDSSHSCDLRHSCGNARSFNPLRQARHWRDTRILALERHQWSCCTIGGTPTMLIFMKVRSIRDMLLGSKVRKLYLDHTHWPMADFISIWRPAVGYIKKHSKTKEALD